MKNNTSVLHKISLIHFVILVIVLCGFSIAVLFFTKSRKHIYIDMTYYSQEWREDPMPPSFWESDAVRVGDSSYNWRGDKTIEITQVQKTDWKGARKAIQVTARISVVYDSRTHQYTYNDIPILIGNKFIVNTERSVFIGQITNVYSSPSQRYAHLTKRDASIVIQSRWLNDWHAESLRDFQVTDESGNAVIILKDIQIKPAEMDVETDSGIVYKGFSTIFKDVILTLEMKNVYCSDQTCYYVRYFPLKVGEKVSLYSNTDAIVDGQIVSFSLK